MYIIFGAYCIIIVMWWSLNLKKTKSTVFCCGHLMFNLFCCEVLQECCTVEKGAPSCFKEDIVGKVYFC